MLLSDRSIKRLEEVHPDLVRVVMRAAKLDLVPFEVLEGVRSEKRQKALLAAGATTTMKSRHLTGHAVDLGAVVDFTDLDGDGKDDDGVMSIRWDWPLYSKLASLVKQAAFDLAIPIEWGGDWQHFKDGPHFQLPWAEYPTARL